MNNERQNAEGYYSSLGNTVTMRIDVDLLAKEEQLSLLRRLMVNTGTTAAILSHEKGMEISELIGKQWERFTK